MHIHGTSRAKCFLWLWIHRAKLLCCSFQNGCQQCSRFAGDILSSSISIYHVHSPTPAPLLPSYMKECPILHERATNREIHPVITLPTLWSYFLRYSTCQLSVVSRGKTPLSGDKQGTLTGTWHKKRGVKKILAVKTNEQKEQLPTILFTFKVWQWAHRSPRRRIFTEILAFSKPDGEH